MACIYAADDLLVNNNQENIFNKAYWILFKLYLINFTAAVFIELTTLKGIIWFLLVRLSLTYFLIVSKKNSLDSWRVDSRRSKPCRLFTNDAVTVAVLFSLDAFISFFILSMSWATSSTSFLICTNL